MFSGSAYAISQQPNVLDSLKVSMVPFHWESKDAKTGLYIEPISYKNCNG